MRVWGLDKVVIAAVHGYCLGGANHLAGLADITIAASDATFGDPEIRFGNPLLVPILPELTGVKAVRRMLYLGESLTGDEAARCGLVTAATDARTLEQTVDDLAELLADHPTRRNRERQTHLELRRATSRLAASAPRSTPSCSA